MFSIKSAYSILKSPLPTEFTQIPLFHKVSEWKGPARIRAHHWKSVHGCLFTNEERGRRGMTQDTLCPRCNSAPESLMHMMRDCEVVQNFWNHCIDPSLRSKFFSIGLHQWLDWNLSSKTVGSSPWNWNLLFSVTVRMNWKDGNSLVFSSSSSMNSSFWAEVSSQVHLFEKEIQSPSIMTNSHFQNNQSFWKKLGAGWYKCNSHGSYKQIGGSSSCGGIIRKKMVTL